MTIIYHTVDDLIQEHPKSSVISSKYALARINCEETTRQIRLLQNIGKQQVVRLTHVQAGEILWLVSNLV